MQQFLQPQARNAALLLGGDAELRRGIILEALLEKRKHLLAAFSGRADDEDPPEFLFVLLVSRGEIIEGLFGGSLRGGLL